MYIISPIKSIISRIMVINVLRHLSQFWRNSHEGYNGFYLISSNLTVSRKDFIYSVEVVENPEENRSPLESLLPHSSPPEKNCFLFLVISGTTTQSQQNHLKILFYRIHHKGLEIFAVYRDGRQCPVVL